MEAVNFSAKFYNTVMTCIARAVQIISLEQRMEDGLLTYNVASPTIQWVWNLMVCKYRYEYKKESFAALKILSMLPLYLCKTLVEVEKDYLCIVIKHASHW